MTPRALAKWRSSAGSLWAVQSYLDRNYTTARPVGPKGLTGRLYVACTPTTSGRPWLADFAAITRESCFLTLSEIERL